MTTDKSTRCPICGDGRLLFLSHEVSRWSCGTRGPDDAGEYDTGMECDKIVFQNGFLRCRELVEKVAASEFLDCGEGHVSCVMPRELLLEIRKETDR